LHFVLCTSYFVLGAVSPSPQITVATDARSVQPGELVVLTVTTPAPIESLRVTAFDHDLPSFRVEELRWQALVGIDLDVKPGRYAVTVRTGPASHPEALTHYLQVRSKPFPTRTLKVDDAFVNPPAAVQGRIDEEARELARLWTASADARLWTEPFVRPVPQAANSAFGTRSILNGQARSPHGGADFASPAGTPVHAPNAGRVVLAKPLYYTGNTVVLDHGLGLVSLFAHLSVLDAREGETIAPGAIIGRVGATGRVTGPHLHWAVRANGARIDPLSLLAVLGAK
jgi:murein DD-endopeptidase MepM/ murein hydrolase activator NlpD